MTKIELLRSLEGQDELKFNEESRAGRWGLLLALLLSGALAGAGVMWLARPSAPATAVVETAPPRPGVAPNSGALVASGYVIARRRATVAAEVTGRVISAPVQEGQLVGQGQVLAVLDSSIAQADLANAGSRVAAAAAAMRAVSAEYEEARRSAERTTELARRGYATNAKVGEDMARMNQLLATLSQARAQLAAVGFERRRAAAALAKYTIRAPFSGIVINKSAQVGEIISPVSAGGGYTRTGICTIVDMTSLEIEVMVNEASVSRVRSGQTVTATLAAFPGVTFAGVVIATIPAVAREQATVPVRIRFARRDLRIVPDMAVTVSFDERSN